MYQPGRTDRSSVKYLVQTDNQSMEVGAEVKR